MHVTIHQDDGLASRTAEQKQSASYAPPDPYARDVASLRAAESPAFEDSYKADRMRDVMRTRATLDAMPKGRLTAAELSAYAASDPWAAGIQALKEA